MTSVVFIVNFKIILSLKMTVDFQTLIQDADANFISGRLKDATRGFSYIVEKSAESRKFEEMLYASYRLLLCYNPDDIFNTVSVIYNLAKTILQSSALVLADRIKLEVNLVAKKELLKLLEKILKHLDEAPNIEKLRIVLYDIYEKLINEYDATSEEKKEFAKEMLDYAQRLDDLGRIEYAQNLLAKLN